MINIDLKTNDIKNKIPKSLTILANEFSEKGAKLYIVGGFCRNHFLNISSSDIDICSSLQYDKVKQICSKLNYDCVEINKKLGTMLITSGSDRYEYTTFRKENYPKGGYHAPNEIEFVEDLFVDAKRRDFTVNSIYYDVLADEFVDPYNGINDVYRRIIRCVETPEFVFSSDGLRLLRMIKFSNQLGFKIHAKTLKVAKEQGYLLKDISAERIAKELGEIVVADYKYEKSKLKVINQFNKLDFLRHVFILNYSFKIKNNVYLRKFIDSDKEFRYEAFLMLVLLNYLKFSYTAVNNLVFVVNRLFGNDGIKCGIDLKKLIKMYDFIQKYLFCPHTQMLYAEYHNLKGDEKNIVNIFCDKVYLSKGVLALKNFNIPLNERALKISNETLVGIVSNKNISKIREQLFLECFCGVLTNEEKNLADRAIEINNYLNKNKTT